MKKMMLFVLLLTFTMIMAACGSSTTKNTTETASATASGDETKTEEVKEITVTHQLGETTVKKNPEKVVVFDFGVLDTLDKLGVEVTGVPQANIPQYLSKFTESTYENVGSLKEPDFEKISEIAPDLIIISGRQQALYEDLQEIAPTIFMGVDTSKYMESFTANSKQLGEIFGKEKEVETELAKVEKSIKALNEKATNDGKTGLIVLANEGNISAYGAGSRFGIIHDVFGVKPADEKIEVSTHGMNVSFEYIAEKNPDYLFVIDRSAAVGGQSSAKQTIDNDLVKGTNAFKDDNIVYLDPNYWYLSGGGLISVSEMVKEIEAGLK
ncbi:siderophore ABC transporter substrate-binding protein [Bacillus suaedaesalsae]|uniref:Siderophore ABC transporter substrate-binding protein n=1 Tax=Bacillus suaedaesalsae TaxID=2810349 RepID=A0ABS2DKJ5_9BACI|nr:siderophore ABC transporter substrate-binding protein [Bacillus suaedaesalsae]MBM6618927.1 siderophore ABC transporter substrate-binding protein [Bacillus suaedaesalsae]